MTYSSDRLDRIEALLAATAEGLSRTEMGEGYTFAISEAEPDELRE
jgi:hypothetical protein